MQPYSALVDGVTGIYDCKLGDALTYLPLNVLMAFLLVACKALQGMHAAVAAVMLTSVEYVLQVALTELRSLLYWVLDYLHVVGSESGNDWTTEVRTGLALILVGVSYITKPCLSHTASRSSCYGSHAECISQSAWQVIQRCQKLCHTFRLVVPAGFVA